MHALAAAALLVLGAAPAHAVSGGRTIDPSQAPFVAKVGGCTGTLIAPDRVLTAAHCLDGQNPVGYTVVVGADPARDRDAARLAVRGFSLEPHFKLSFPFDRSTPGSAIAVSDVALVLLAEPVKNITPVRVAGPGDAALERSGRTARLYGYGATKPISTTKPVGTVPLHEGTVKLIGRATCGRSYPKAVTNSMICSVERDGRRPYTQACPGDSGGPLVVSGPKGPVQVGVTSWGPETMNAKCGARPLPSVAMRVAAYHAFITARDPVIAPFPTAPPTVAGEPRPGGTLTCAATLGGSPARIGYRWVTTRFSGQLRDDNADHLIKPIAGATSSTLQVAQSLAGRKVACEVRASNGGGHTRVFSRNVVIAP